MNTYGTGVSVSDRNREILRYLGTHGIEAKLRLVDRLPLQGSYRVLFGSTKEAVLLSETLAGAIFLAF